jgi:hypothetical protein
MPVTQGHHPLPPTAPGNAHVTLTRSGGGRILCDRTPVDFRSPNYVVKCTNMLEIKAAHLDYWRGVRYDSTGNKSVVGVGADTDDHVNDRQGGAGGIDEEEKGRTGGDDVGKGEGGAEGGAEDSGEGGAGGGWRK